MVHTVSSYEDDEGWITPDSSKEADSEEQSKSSSKSCVGRCCSVLCRIVIIGFVVQMCLFALLVYRVYHSNWAVQYSDRDSVMGGDEGFSILDLFGFQRQLPEYPVSLSLEEINTGITREFPVETTQQCPYCHGEGFHTHPCPLCGGRGVMNTPRGMVYCSRCGGHGVIPGDTCDYCHGSGSLTRSHTIQLTVPPGAPDGWSRVYKLEDGQQVRIRMREKAHSVFTRSGDDIVMHTKLSLKEALLGTKIDIPTLTGNTERVDLPSGSIQPFQEVRLKGKGLPRQGVSLWNAVQTVLRRNRGDLVVVVEIVFPTKLTSEQRQGILDSFCLVCLERRDEKVLRRTLQNKDPNTSVGDHATNNHTDSEDVEQEKRYHGEIAGSNRSWPDRKEVLRPRLFPCPPSLE